MGFDENYYIQNYEDVRAAISNGLFKSAFDHYDQFGFSEGRNAQFTPNNKIGKTIFYYKKFGVFFTARCIWRYLLGNSHYDLLPAIDINTAEFEKVQPVKSIVEKLTEVVDISFYSEHFRSLNSKSVHHISYEENEIGFLDFENAVKPIAFYLPQYHPIEINDKVWGKGFTEWKNVTKAIPQFVGHAQPNLPADLGFYDLRLKEVMQQQIEIAKNYGIYGFCIYYYWFSGERLLEKPLDLILNNKDLNFPFCICWANENWTRRWDGLDDDIIIKQKDDDESAKKFIHDVLNILIDPRYIKVNNKPFLVVYRPELIPNTAEVTQYWRTYFKEKTGMDLFLVNTHSFQHLSPDSFGFDAAIEFAPNTFPLEKLNDLNFYNKNFSGQVYDYSSALKIAEKFQTPEYKKFRGACPSWDNEARKPGKGNILHGSTPSLFKVWYELLNQYTMEKFKPEERFVFINAWNEWAEGAYLEPDQKNGYAYLKSIYDVQSLNDTRTKNLIYLQNIKFKKSSNNACILHLYYTDLIDELNDVLMPINNHVDLFISIPESTPFRVIKKVVETWPNCYIKLVSNKGRDFLPFVKVLPIVEELEYELCCKIHSKKSVHRIDGDMWRNQLLKNLINENFKEEVELKFLLDKELGVLAPFGNMFKVKDYLGSNINDLRILATRFNISLEEILDSYFVAGSMFWFRVKNLASLSTKINEEDFQSEMGQLDGTFAHALERFIVAYASHQKSKTLEVYLDTKIDLIGQLPG